MKVDGWLILSIVLLVGGLGVVIPSFVNTSVPLPEEIIEKADNRYCSADLICDVPLFEDDNDRITRYERAYIEKCISRDEYVSAVRDISIMHFEFDSRYAYLAETNDNLPQKTIDSIRNALRTSEEHSGHPYSDYQKAVWVCMAVRTGISYWYDSEWYGVDDYIASPLETMYLGRGDCEDSALLFVAITRAFGLDSVPVTFDQHVAAGVKLDGGYGWDAEGYRVFDCEGYARRYIRDMCPDYSIDEVERVCDSYNIFDKIVYQWGRYCNWLHRYIRV